MPPIIDLGTDAGDLRYASAFLDVRIRVPDAAAAGDAPADVGFAIYAGTKGDVACVNPAMNYPVKTQVVIDGVTLEPIVP